MTAEREKEIRKHTEHIGCYECFGEIMLSESLSEIDSLREQLKTHRETLQKLDIVSAKCNFLEEKLDAAKREFKFIYMRPCSNKEGCPHCIAEDALSKLRGEK